MTPARSTTPRLPEPTARPSPVDRLRSWLQASHPFPILMVLSLTALVGIASARDDLDARRLGLVLTAMLLAQLAIGWTNDYVDREADARFQPSKPIPAGMVSVRWLVPAIVVATLLCFAVGAPLGPLPLLFLVLGTAAGLAYDIFLKDTRLSWLPYIVAFSVLPPFVWSGLDVFRSDFLWLYLIALPLPLAAHLANALPDIETDSGAGRRGIAVLLGRRNTLWLLAATMLAPIVLLVVPLVSVKYDVAVLSGTLAVYAVLLAGAALAYRRGNRRSDVWGFRFIGAAAVLFACGWLGAV
jgi:4-hydroxybenzoate polyprenyltransferase